MTGRKDDAGKDDWTLMPWRALRPVVRVLMHGGQKYDRDNWQKVANGRHRYSAAAMRHMTAWLGGERTDAETGLSHLAHATCCLLFLIWIEMNESGQLGGDK